MATGRTYSYIVKSASGIGLTPWIQIATPSATAIELLRVEIGEEDSTTSQMETLELTRRTTNSTLPNVAERVPLNPNDPGTLLAGTSITNAIGIATGTGSFGASIMRWNFNVLNGLLYVPVPEERPVLAPTNFYTFQFTASPAANTWSGHIIYREMT